MRACSKTSPASTSRRSRASRARSTRGGGPPVVGAPLVEPLPLHPWVSSAVGTHHEWFDGWGFPQGLKGEEIPLGGRVLAAAELLVGVAPGDAVAGPVPRGR